MVHEQARRGDGRSSFGLQLLGWGACGWEEGRKKKGRFGLVPRLKYVPFHRKILSRIRSSFPATLLFGPPEMMNNLVPIHAFVIMLRCI